MTHAEALWLNLSITVLAVVGVVRLVIGR